MLDYIIGITGVSEEVLTGIGQRLEDESPLSHTMMLTQCNGSAGYIPDDQAYDKPSYEVVSGSQIIQGSEDGVIHGLLEMKDRPK